MLMHFWEFFEKTFMTRCKGVFPSQSALLTSAPRIRSFLTIQTSSLTTARCMGLPNIPPPKFTSTPGELIRITAGSNRSSLIARHRGVQLSLSSMFGLALPKRRPSMTPASPFTAALWSGVRYLLSTLSMLKSVEVLP